MNYSKYRENDVRDKLYLMGVTPLDVMITGVTGAGKSTTLNAIFEKTVAKVGDGVVPETMKLASYSLNESIRLWDTPGLGDGIRQDEIHSKKMIDLLHKTYSINNQEYGFIDMAIIVIEGSRRDMGTTYKLLNEVIAPNISGDRILVIINKADMALSGRNWNSDENIPGEALKKFLDEQAQSIQRRVREATGVEIRKPVYYSAQYQYNIEGFLDFIIDNIPRKRRVL